ncbi:MAG: hypothetical protein ACJZ64_07120 [Opitutales bacterium]
MTNKRSGGQRGWPKGAIAQMGPCPVSGVVLHGEGASPSQRPVLQKAFFSSPPCHREGFRPWRSTVHKEPNR